MITICKRKKSKKIHNCIHIKRNVIIIFNNPKCRIIKKKRCHKKKKLTSKKKKISRAVRRSPARKIPKLQVKPAVHRYFYIPSSDLSLSEQLRIPAKHFIDDHGENVDHFLLNSEESYYNLYINGVMQEGKIFKADSLGLTIIETGQQILAGTPIILEVVSFTIKNNAE